MAPAFSVFFTFDCCEIPALASFHLEKKSFLSSYRGELSIPKKTKRMGYYFYWASIFVLYNFKVE